MNIKTTVLSASLATSASLLGLLSSSATAANLIVNGSFENGSFVGPDFTRVSAGENTITGWTVGGNAVDWHDSTSFTSPQDGNFLVDLNLDGNGLPSDTGTLSQSFSTIAGNQYQLTFYLAGTDNFSNPRQVTVDIAGINQTFSATTSPNTALVWEEQTLLFEATSSSTTLTFSSPDSTGFWGPLLDNVSVQSTPEPSSVMALLGIGGLGLLSRRKKEN